MLREDGPRLKLCRRKLGSHMVAATNLAPIISHHASNSDVVFNARTLPLAGAETLLAGYTHKLTVKVATFLTMPLPPKGQLSFNVEVCNVAAAFKRQPLFTPPGCSYPPGFFHTATTHRRTSC